MSSELLNLIVAVLSGLVTAIPLIATLIKYIQRSIKEKNWSNLLKIVSDLMIEAESKFQTGAERKEWVLSMVYTLSESINYDLDRDAISNLIDSLCALTKKVNVKS
jgi:hypothetical protein